MTDLKTLDPNDLAPFQPNTAQERAKARLELRLRDLGGVTDFQNLTPDELVEYSGDRRVLRWLEDPQCVQWFAERDTFQLSILALRPKIAEILKDILDSDYEPKILAAKDKLKAIEVWGNFAGAFPAKQREVRFLDGDLDKMPDDQVKAETAKLTAALAKQSKLTDR